MLLFGAISVSYVVLSVSVFTTFDLPINRTPCSVCLTRIISGDVNIFPCRITELSRSDRAVHYSAACCISQRYLAANAKFTSAYILTCRTPAGICDNKLFFGSSELHLIELYFWSWAAGAGIGATWRFAHL